MILTKKLRIFITKRKKHHSLDKKLVDSGGSSGYASSKEEGERVIEKLLSNLIFSI